MDLQSLRSILLIIFDVDGTLIQTKSGDKFRRSADDWQWKPGRLEMLRDIKRLGIEIAVATNQGGIAFGYMQEGDMQTQLSIMCNEAKIPHFVRLL